MTVWPGLLIKHTYRVGGNSHTYHLRALVDVVLGPQPDFGYFEVLNPTTYAMTTATALSSNPVLQAGDRLMLVDTGALLENTLNVALPYTVFVTEKIHSGKRASIGFKTGANLTQHYELRNGFQTKKPQGGGIAPMFTKSFSLEVLNAPSSFSGFVKIVNKTDFDAIRTTFPVQTLASVPVVMSYPDVTVTVTYDIGSSYLNDNDTNDFFYLKFERSGGNLIVTRYANNTTPDGV